MLALCFVMWYKFLVKLKVKTRQASVWEHGFLLFQNDVSHTPLTSMAMAKSASLRSSLYIILLICLLCGKCLVYLLVVSIHSDIAVF